MNVVLAEEDTGMRSFIRSMIGEQVTQVIEVGGAQECLSIVMATTPEVVLLGAVDLRDEHGRELPGLLRRASPKTGVVVLGARSPAGLEDSRSDVNSFLPYPFRAERLLDEMNRAANVVNRQSDPTYRLAIAD